MLEYKLNGNELEAAIEYYIVDKEGKLDDKGEYIWIHDFIVAPKFRRKGHIAYFAKKIMEKVPQAKVGYFRRGKHNNRVSMYGKGRWKKIVNKGGEK